MTAITKNEKELLVKGVEEVVEEKPTEEVVEEKSIEVVEKPTEVVEEKPTEVVEEKPVEEVKNYKTFITLWKRTTNDGKRTFLSGVNKNNNVVGYFAGKKINPKEPDLKIYFSENGSILSELAYLWVHVSSNGNKYYSGYIANTKINLIGFVDSSDNPKAPYLRVYKKSDIENSVEEHSEEIKENINNQVDVADDDLPF